MLAILQLVRIMDYCLPDEPPKPKKSYDIEGVRWRVSAGSPARFGSGSF